MNNLLDLNPLFKKQVPFSVGENLFLCFSFSSELKSGPAVFVHFQWAKLLNFVDLFCPNKNSHKNKHIFKDNVM